VIPPEVAAARRILTERPRFGDKSQIEAIKIMSRWHEVACAYCTDGWHHTNGTNERYICNVCRGEGKVWTRR
jgi:hypothetical protein